MRLQLLFITSALADRSPWPRSPLDAERGPDGVMLVKNSAMLGDVQWDLDGSCAHTGAKGYRVVVADSPYRSDDAMLVLPPFPVPPQGAVKLTFWARVLVPFGTRAPSEPPRVRSSFSPPTLRHGRPSNPLLRGWTSSRLRLQAVVEEEPPQLRKKFSWTLGWSGCRSAAHSEPGGASTVCASKFLQRCAASSTL